MRTLFGNQSPIGNDALLPSGATKKEQQLADDRFRLAFLVEESELEEGDVEEEEEGGEEQEAGRGSGDTKEDGEKKGKGNGKGKGRGKEGRGKEGGGKKGGDDDDHDEEGGSGEGGRESDEKGTSRSGKGGGGKRGGKGGVPKIKKKKRRRDKTAQAQEGPRRSKRGRGNESNSGSVKAHFAGFVQHAPGHWLAYRYSATEDCFFRIDSMDPTVRVARWREVVTELFPFNFFCAAPSQPIHNSITMFTSKEAGLAFHKKLVMIRRSGRYSAPGRQASKLDFDLT